MALHWNVWSIPMSDWNSLSYLDIPPIVSFISLLVLAGASSHRQKLEGDVDEGGTFLSRLAHLNFRHDERVIAVYEILRLWGVAALLTLSLSSLAERQDLANTAYAFACFYCLLLSVTFFLTTYPNARTSLTNHLSVVLGTAFSVYAYHDLRYLATTDEIPPDNSWSVWARISLLSLVGFAIPLFIPRRYVPVNPKEPCPPPPDQTASIFSLLTFNYLNHLVWFGYRNPQISTEDLPPLADYNHAKVIRESAFHYVNPENTKNRRHIFFNLLRAFKWQFSLLSIPLLMQTMFNFSFPLAIRNLLETLKYTERKTIHPWVWIAVLFIGPMGSAISVEMYFYYSKRLVFQVEALLTQIIFQRVLKMPLASDSHNNVADNANSAVDGIEDVKSEAHNMVGKISSLVTTDMTNISNASNFVCFLVYIPPHIAVGMWFLYSILGWSSVVGLSVLVTSLALPTYIAKVTQGVEETRMKTTDARVQAVTEALSLARMVKLFGWEDKMEKNLGNRREEELKWIRKREVLGVGRTLSSSFVTALTMLTTYTLQTERQLQTLVFKKELSTAAVFSSAAVFSTLRNILELSFQLVGHFIPGKVSMDRVNEFLNETETLEFQSQQSGCIGFHDASFTWNASGPSSENFSLKVPGGLLLDPGTFNVVLGPTASGKTSLLMALLGEMKFSPLSPKGRYNLPRDHGVAYAAQESWVLNMTIRENIVFGSVYDEKRYKKVIAQCCLEADLAEFPAGDDTEVGEKGVTLSGGQKARITLARAVYSQARILLLDDVLAALDVRTTKWIIENCFAGDLIKGRTVLVATHNMNALRSVADTFVTVSNKGEVRLTEKADFVRNTGLAEQYETQSVVSEAANSDEIKADGKLVLQEEVEIGHVKWETARMYISALCGRYSLLVIPAFISGLLLNEVFNTAQVWFLGQWGNAYDTAPPDIVPSAGWYLSIYGALSLVPIIMAFIVSILYISRILAASKHIHNKLIHSVLHSTLRWLDMTPTSRILARCTQDIGTIDSTIPTFLKWLCEMLALMLIKLAMIVYITPSFLLPGLLIASIGAWMSNFYLKTQLSVNREASKAKAPILDQFVTITNGLVSIRAYGIQDLVTEELRSRVDRQTRANLIVENLIRWIAVRTTFVSAIFTSSIAAYLVSSSTKNYSLSDIGISLEMAGAFTGVIFHIVTVFNDLEVKANSLERARQYIQIEQEAKPSTKGVPPAYWPASGDLRVSNLSASYKEDGPQILRDLSFTIHSGEHVGIVGRTGSGKSSLVLSLLRAIHTKGSVYYDGVDIGTLNLDALRSKISVIPQTPQLFTATLRENLDPFSEYDDAQLNSALELSGFFTLNELAGSQKLALDTVIHNGGLALSVGQRQILALARAIVRGSKVLILDEATSSIDNETDSIIHSSLRRLEGDITILTIAHRLHTIADADKILVLDKGSLIEFGTPESLMKCKTGVFRKMVIESGEQERLEGLMEAARL